MRGAYEAILNLFDKKEAFAILIRVAYEYENTTKRAVLDNEPLVGLYLKPPSRRFSSFFKFLYPRESLKYVKRFARVQKKKAYRTTAI